MKDTGESLSPSTALDRILSDLLILACSTTTAEVGILATADTEAGDLRIRHTYGPPLAGIVEGARWPSDTGFSGWCMANRQTALVADVAADPRFVDPAPLERELVPRDMVCVPLVGGECVIGVVTLFNKLGGTFNVSDAKLIESVGALATSVIEGERLFEVERNNRYLAQTLSAFSMAITQSLDVDVVLRVLLDYLGRLVPYDKAVAVFVEWDLSFAVRAFRASDGTSLLDPDSPSTFDGGDIPTLREMMDDLKGRVVQDVRSDPTWAGFPCAEDTGSWIGIPLVASGRVFGMYTLSKDTVGFYGDDHLRLAGVLASQASAAIQSAWLFEKVGEGRARLQSLSRQLVRVQENERRAVSRELHDEAGQSLASLKLGLHLLEEKAGDPAAVRSSVSELRLQVEELMLSLHRLASNLRPASLDHVGLRAAVQQIVETSNLQDGPRVEFEGGAVGNLRLPEITETALYRIVQEALTNARRHSRATVVSVLLERRDGKIVAVIEDDGIGFDPVLALHSGRLGLLGMRERAEMIGGSLIVESAEGKGTTIAAEVPDVDPDIAR